MDGLSASVLAGFADAPAELLLVVPAALGVAAIRWGGPVMVGFFKRLAK
ncbi:hypothetical protein [Nocardioides sp. LML1-1-1.1]